MSRVSVNYKYKLPTCFTLNSYVNTCFFTYAITLMQYIRPWNVYLNVHDVPPRPFLTRIFKILIDEDMRPILVPIDVIVHRIKL